jgi:hypothetical protein
MTLANISLLKHALKEWAIAVSALETGKTIVLLRKGGIRESKFQPKYARFWLYPTYEHQQPHLLKPEYATDVTPVESGWHPETVRISSYGEISKVFTLSDRKLVAALQPYHIWSEEMIRDRLKWKPQQPLTVLLLRVYRLLEPQTIVYQDAYGGCKSWIELVEPISTKQLTPVIDDRRYSRQVAEIMELESQIFK